MQTRTRRPGFTLTELIVAMSIILILSTIVVTLLPRLGQQERAARGADQVQRVLLIAKQRALSERTPVGIRLIQQNPNDPNSPVFELHYIGQPEPYSKGRFLNGGANSSTFSPDADFFGGRTTAGNAEDDPVQAGDYLEVFGGGPVTQITRVTGANSLTHLSPMPTGVSPTTNYRIIRQPRRIQGEAPVLLPQDIGIDIPNSRNIPARTVGTVTFREILFAPGGGVIGRGTAGDKIILWVRDVTQDSPTIGAPTLIVIYTRTGLIAAHPVDVGNPADPYSFTRDPRSSGL